MILSFPALCFYFILIAIVFSRIKMRERDERRERERSTGHVEGCMAEFIVNAGAK